MLFFGKRKKEFQEKEAKFNRQLVEANRILDSLDFKISEFKRKFATLQMRGKRAQSVAELERMLYDMHLQAEQAEKAVRELEADHEDCVAAVDLLIREFEEALPDVPD